MLYLTSHPSVLESVYMPGNDTFVLAQQGGLSIIWYALLTLCVLGECGMALKKNPRRSYLFAQVLLYAMAACIIFMAFFWGVVEVKNLWSEFGALPEELREHAAANYFSFIFTLLCEIYPLRAESAAHGRARPVRPAHDTAALRRGFGGKGFRAGQPAFRDRVQRGAARPFEVADPHFVFLHRFSPFSARRLPCRHRDRRNEARHRRA